MTSCLVCIDIDVLSVLGRVCICASGILFHIGESLIERERAKSRPRATQISRIRIELTIRAVYAHPTRRWLIHNTSHVRTPYNQLINPTPIMGFWPLQNPPVCPPFTPHP
jgi:hypothetical protein